MAVNHRAQPGARQLEARAYLFLSHRADYHPAGHFGKRDFLVAEGLELGGAHLACKSHALP